MSTFLYSKTPSVTVFDNRGLTVREMAYRRHPDTPDTTDERITRHQFSARGFPAQSADPRLAAAGLVNFGFISDLGGTPQRTQSADAGTSVVLNDAAGRTFLQVSNIGAGNDRSAAVTRTFQYEDASLPGRLLGITEQSAGNSAHVTERFIRGGTSADEQSYNLAGQVVSHYDTAGLLSTTSISLSGVPLSVTRQLLPDDAEADWQGVDESAWNDLLSGESYTTQSTVDATGTVLTTLDAKGNQQRVAYDVAGLLKGSWLTINGGSEQIIVKSLTWSAAGQKLREEHGNGVVTTYSYEAETQRLVGIKTERITAAKVLQDLRYGYDPVGNVLVITNDAEETRFWRNQQVVPENRYTYDSLYQLISATGREMANAAQQSSSRPDFFSFDDATYTNYSRTYTYDNAGNLTKIQHSAPASGNNYTTSMTVSDRSNRAVLSTFTENPADVEALFTAGGQQKQLLPGQTLQWTPRQELQQVTPVTRDGAADDSESYRYDAASQRIVKTTSQLTGNTTQTKRGIYLPGLELRSSAAEELQVITVGEAGRAQVRVLHWESGQPDGISNDPIRYSYDNLTGSSALEVDGNGELISQEEYYPFGGTALFAARSQLEADYKTIRYSGKEQDATGLYYYGYRYYQPWAGRWLSADPVGTMDGLNLFMMVRDNPVTLYDNDGRVANETQRLRKYSIKNSGLDEEIITAKSILEEAIKKLEVPKLEKKTKEDIREILKGGANAKKIKTTELKGEILLRFKFMQAALSKSKTMYDEEGKEQGNLAYVLNNDPERKIYFSEAHLEHLGSVRNIHSILHEVSHFSGVKRSGKFHEIFGETGTQDYFYTPSSPRNIYEPEEYVKELTGDTQIILKGMDLSGINRNAKVKRTAIDIALHNADTLSLIALKLGFSRIKKMSTSTSNLHK